MKVGAGGEQAENELVEQMVGLVTSEPDSKFSR